MTQFLHVVEDKKSLPKLDTDLCYYINLTSKMEIVRITNIPNWYFERVIFPQERLLFHAPAQAQLEIYTHEMATAILADKISCTRLQVQSSII
jgi:hypothetical protein